MGKRVQLKAKIITKKKRKKGKKEEKYISFRDNFGAYGPFLFRFNSSC